MLPAGSVAGGEARTPLTSSVAPETANPRLAEEQLWDGAVVDPEQHLAGQRLFGVGRVGHRLG
jgi:hypothetical protein